jgi:hypothetical protein
MNIRICARWIGNNTFKNAVLAAIPFLFVLGIGSAWAGPPFVTDDPVPVDFKHWEIYIASQWEYNRHEGTSATLPHFEVNYGVISDMQLHAIVPMAYSAPLQGSTQYGLGDMEFGFKYRFIHEDEKGWTPQVAIFPIINVPAGDSSRGLGEGKIKMFFPIWLQKSWGPWTTCGGGGYWYHPGKENKNYWLAGWLLQRELSEAVTLGAEFYNTSPQAKGESDETGFNMGGFINLSNVHHILFSAGRGFKGPNIFSAYIAFQWTFGPKGENSN